MSGLSKFILAANVAAVSELLAGQDVGRREGAGVSCSEESEGEGQGDGYRGVEEINGVIIIGKRGPRGRIVGRDRNAGGLVSIRNSPVRRLLLANAVPVLARSVRRSHDSGLREQPGANADDGVLWAMRRCARSWVSGEDPIGPFVSVR